MVRELEISDAEWRIMHVVWDRQPVPAHTVIATLCEPNDWSPATIRTMLHRLVKKGVLSYKQQGNRYFYRASVRRVDCLRKAAHSFVDRVFDGEAAPMLSQMMQSTKLSRDEIAELKQILDQQEADQ